MNPKFSMNFTNLINACLIEIFLVAWHGVNFASKGIVILKRQSYE